MKYETHFEIKAIDRLDDESIKFYESLTPKQWEEAVAAMKADVKSFIEREMENPTEVIVDIRIKEVVPE